jgi:hypothetical protein
VGVDFAARHLFSVERLRLYDLHHKDDLGGFSNTLLTVLV